MILLSSIIQSFEAEFLADYQDRLLPGQRQALAAMKQCRTSLSPKMLAQCDDCDQQRLVPHSCGHRHCPHCQSHESQQWLERQLQKQVPAEYFLPTFTLPKELRPLAFQQQRMLYDLLIRCSWDTVNTFARNDRQLQGNAGASAVLHTHSRRLNFHDRHGWRECSERQEPESSARASGDAGGGHRSRQTAVANQARLNRQG